MPRYILVRTDIRVSISNDEMKYPIKYTSHLNPEMQRSVVCCTNKNTTQLQQQKLVQQIACHGALLTPTLFLLAVIVVCQ